MLRLLPRVLPRVLLRGRPRRAPAELVRELVCAGDEVAAVRAQRPFSSGSGGFAATDLVEVQEAEALRARGLYAEALGRLDRAVEIIQAVPQLCVQVRERKADVLRDMARFADEVADRDVVLAAQSPALVGHVTAFAASAVARLRSGEAMGAMLGWAGEHRTKYEDAGNERGVLRAMQVCGLAAMMGGDLGALATFEACVTHSAAEIAGGELIAADSLRLVASCELNLCGDVAHSIDCLRQAKTVVEAHAAEDSDVSSRVGTRMQLSEALLRQKDSDGARAELGEAITLLEKAYDGSHPALSACLAQYGHVARMQGDPATSEGLYRTSIDNLKRMPVKNSTLAHTLARILMDFADLLDHLEWNGVKRTKEGSDARDEARKVLLPFDGRLLATPTPRRCLRSDGGSKEQPRPHLDDWIAGRFARDHLFENV